MYLIVLKRYISCLIGWTLLAACLWLATIWLAEGWLPTMAFVLVLGTALFSIPVRIYLDYREIREQVLQLNEVRKGQGDLTPYLGILAEKIAEKTGMPSLLVEFVVGKTQEPLQKWLAKRQSSSAQANA
ncbi:hypothetical protein RBE51_18270 [Pseudomonas taiwanensis]|uniref:hypothetical protein n=1 Tax=Pseudomonas taiwanensis TaxID=470150 RepID=UPI0028E01EB7|nr:hypothetical protein [Pseudomonas taiwanensis]MDT8924742.1 hypothetical protein [Pseudomonas taiwanensis]